MDIDFSAFESLAKNHSTEEGVNAQFYDRSVKTDAIDAQGFPVFKNVCFCKIRIKDNNSEVFDQPANDDKKKRFPQEYARYLLSKKQVAEGTPLEQFAFLSLAEVDALKIRGIFTVEALANLSQEKAQSLGVAKEQKLAQKFAEQALGNKQIADWQQKEEQYQYRIKQQEEEIYRLRKSLHKRGNRE